MDYTQTIRQGELIDKKHLEGLTNEEARELEQINAEINASLDEYYAPIKSDLGSLIEAANQMDNAQLINQTSGIYEYYTPQVIVEAARRVMGGIDLDPASSACANDRVKANFFFDKEDNGLNCKWWGWVWLNHPFSRSGNRIWIERLINEYVNGDVQQACCITYASTSEAWFRPLLDYPMAFIYPRVNYILPDGTEKKGVTKGSVVTYLGGNLNAFKREFHGHIGGKYYGKVKI